MLRTAGKNSTIENGAYEDFIQDDREGLNCNVMLPQSNPCFFCVASRFGLMHTLATNVLLWMSVVLDESMKQLEEFYDTHSRETPQASHGTVISSLLSGKDILNIEALGRRASSVPKHELG